MKCLLSFTLYIVRCGFSELRVKLIADNSSLLLFHACYSAARSTAGGETIISTCNRRIDPNCLPAVQIRKFRIPPYKYLTCTYNNAIMAKMQLWLKNTLCC